MIIFDIKELDHLDTLKVAEYIVVAGDKFAIIVEVAWLVNKFELLGAVVRVEDHHVELQIKLYLEGGIGVVTAILVVADHEDMILVLLAEILVAFLQDCLLELRLFVNYLEEMEGESPVAFDGELREGAQLGAA